MEHSAEEDEFHKTEVHNSRCGDDAISKKKKKLVKSGSWR